MFAKLFSAIRRLVLLSRSMFLSMVCAHFMRGITLGKRVFFHKGVHVSCTDGGKLYIGNNVDLCSGAKLIVKGGELHIGDNVHIGESCIIVCREKITVGEDAQIAEFVVLRDQNHSLKSRPIRLAGFDTAPISIGNDVWIGAKATVLKGVTVGDRTVIGAHALVNTSIESDMLAVGVPAKTIKSL